MVIIGSETKLAAMEQWSYSVSNVGVNKYKSTVRFFFLLIYCLPFETPVIVVCQHTVYLA